MRTPILSGLLGFISLANQIVLIREYIAQCQGSEIAWGAFLSAWLVLTGVGATLPDRIGTRLRHDTIWHLLVAQCLFALLSLVLLRSIRFTLGVLPGEPIGMADALLMPLPILAPLCIVNGRTFRLLAVQSELGISDQRGPSYIYAFEAAGGIIAGITLRFGLLIYVQIERIILFQLSIISFSAAMCARRSVSRSIYVLLCLASAAATLRVPLIGTSILERLEWPGADSVRSGESPYGRITIRSQAGETSLFINHALIAHSNESSKAEELTHVPLSLLPSPPTGICIIEGGYSGMIREIRRHSDVPIDVVLRDSMPITLLRSWTPDFLKDGFDQSRVMIHEADAVDFLREHQNYDLIILDLPPPLTIAGSRIYSVECLNLLRQALSPEGIVILRLSIDDNYLNRENLRYARSVSQTFRSVFGESIRLIPGDAVDLIGSKGTLADCASIPRIVQESLEKQSIATYYTSEGYLPFRCGSERCERLALMLLDETDVSEVSTLFRPVVFSTATHAWLAFSRTPGWLVAIFGILIVAAGLTVLLASLPTRWDRLLRPSASISILGLTQMILLNSLLCLLQVIHGDGYLNIALLLSLFTAGLSVGALLSILLSFRLSRIIASSHLVFICIAVFVIGYIVRPDGASVPLIMSLGSITGLAGGAFFAAWSRLHAELTSLFYALDLIASAVGAMLLIGVLLNWPDFRLVMVAIIVMQIVGLIANDRSLRRREDAEGLDETDKNVTRSRNHAR